METCKDCGHWNQNTGAIGRFCPIAYHVKPSFSSGCAAFVAPITLEPISRQGLPTENGVQRQGEAVLGVTDRQNTPILANVTLIGQAARKMPVKTKKTAKAQKASRKTPNSIEQEYERCFLADLGAIYEGYRFVMKNGHKYTPDWVIMKDGEPVEAHEVKGGYAMFSQCRAKLAFDQCKVEFPNVKFVWAKKSKSGWKLK